LSTSRTAQRVEKGEAMLAMEGEKKEKTKSTAALYERLGKKSLTFWVPAKMTIALKVLAAEKEMSMQDMLTEFLNDGLERNGKPRIGSGCPRK
jgi:hypothetical protein